MSDTKYNGWTNYATWRVNLEMFDGFNWVEAFGNPDPDLTDVYELSLALKDYAEEVITNGEIVNSNLAVDYALAFLNDVNWYEIAEHLVNDYVCEQENFGG
jgi:hypothetical protein